MPRMFGTDGVRGIANTELDCTLAYQLGRAGAQVLISGTHRPTVLVGTDTRISGDMLKSALMAGICSVGAHAVDLGVITTPAIAMLNREIKADAGVMISASHNPAKYNGIKFFSGEGYKLSDALEDEIEAIIRSGCAGVPSPKERTSAALKPAGDAPNLSRPAQSQVPLRPQGTENCARLRKRRGVGHCPGAF